MAAVGAAASKPYIVKQGDTLTKIAMRDLGPGASRKQIKDRIKELAHFSGITNLDKIRVGDTIKFAAKAPTSSEKPPTLSSLIKERDALQGKMDSLLERLEKAEPGSDEYSKIQQEYRPLVIAKSMISATILMLRGAALANAIDTASGEW